jgi:hypothetical protein
MSPSKSSAQILVFVLYFSLTSYNTYCLSFFFIFLWKARRLLTASHSISLLFFGFEIRTQCNLNLMPAEIYQGMTWLNQTKKSLTSTWAAKCRPLAKRYPAERCHCTNPPSRKYCPHCPSPWSYPNYPLVLFHFRLLLIIVSFITNDFYFINYYLLLFYLILSKK